MPEETAVAKRPKKKMTDADREMLREFLLRPDARVNGKIHVKTVSALTGLSEAVIYAFMRHDPYLHAQVLEVNPGKLEPAESDLIDPGRPSLPPGVLISNESFAEMQAILRQQKKMVAKDWEALGMTEAMAARIEKMGQAGKAPMVHVIGMLYGGLIRQAATMDEILEKDAKKILDATLPAESDAAGMPVEDGKVQREWRYWLKAGIETQLNIYNSLHKTQAILARVAKDLKAMGEEAKRPEKGVYDAEVTTKPNGTAA